MKCLVILIFLLVTFSVEAQNPIDLDKLEVISNENIHDLSLLSEIKHSEMPADYILQFRINSDSTRVVATDQNTAIWYVDLETFESILLPYNVCDCAPFTLDFHPTIPNLLLFNGRLFNIDANEISYTAPLPAWNVFSDNGQFIATSYSLYNANTGNVIQNFVKEYQSEEYPRVTYSGVDISSNGEIIALEGIYEREGGIPNHWNTITVLNKKDNESISISDPEPFVDDFESTIRISGNGEWLAYTGWMNSDKFDFAVIVISLDDLDTPLITRYRSKNFEFDVNSTFLIGIDYSKSELWWYSLETQKTEIILTGEFRQVEFSPNNKLLITTDDDSLKIWGVPISA